MHEQTPDPEESARREVSSCLKIARAVVAGNPDRAREYARAALNNLWDLYRETGERGVHTMIGELDRDDLERLVLAACDRLNNRTLSLSDLQRRMLALLADRDRVSPDELVTTLNASHEELAKASRPLSEERLVMVCVASMSSWFEITPRGRALARGDDGGAK
jgi:hypothetical protein